jgi:exodeoxyribonuclease VII small subunit
MKTTKKINTEITADQEKENHSFEEAVSELEKIITILERDDLTLDDALQQFEQGIGFVRICDKRLKAAKGKILELVRGEHGELVEKVLGQTLESFLDGEENDD